MLGARNASSWQASYGPKFLQLLQAHTPHDSPGCERVPEGMKVHVIELRVCDGVLIGLPNTFGTEDASGRLWRQSNERFVGF